MSDLPQRQTTEEQMRLAQQPVTDQALTVCTHHAGLPCTHPAEVRAAHPCAVVDVLVILDERVDDLEARPT